MTKLLLAAVAIGTLLPSISLHNRPKRDIVRCDDHSTGLYPRHGHQEG
jgi:hypothetical protein